jgi:hypothetical protein
MSWGLQVGRQRCAPIDSDHVLVEARREQVTDQAGEAVPGVREGEVGRIALCHGVPGQLLHCCQELMRGDASVWDVRAGECP